MSRIGTCRRASTTPHGVDGFLDGPPLWIEQLSALTLEQGIDDSAFGSSCGRDDQLRRFAEEVAPVVREVIANERAFGGPAAKLSIS